MTATIVKEQHDVSDRLTPAISERLAPDTTSDTNWPFLPKDTSMTSPPKPCPPQTTAHCRQPSIQQRRETLLRTSSFVKLRRFCYDSCDVFPNAFLYLQTSRTTLQSSVTHAFAQLKECVLVLAVYLAVICLALQLTACLYALAGKAPPPGLVFMVASLFAIMAAFSQIVVNSMKRKARSSRKRVTFDTKKKN